MRILVLSPYQAASHRVWIDQLVAGFPDFEWRVLSLPARHVRDVGYLDERDYLSFIARGGIVLSTALHELQGLAVMEAAAAGCTPLVPDRLVYPEWFDDRYRYSSCTDPSEAGRVLGRRIMEMLDAGAGPAPPPMDAFRFEVLAGRYRALFKAVV